MTGMHDFVEQLVSQENTLTFMLNGTNSTVPRVKELYHSLLEALFAKKVGVKDLDVRILLYAIVSRL